MARVYTDEDVPHAVAEHLRHLGYDVVTTSEAGRKGLSDVDQLRFTTLEARIFVTHNRRDFMRLHRTVRSHPGIVICTRDDANPVALAERIHQALAAAGTMTNQLVRVNRPSKP
jgi:predicted nuclease of predicted toxin-antitoxin system